jgi:hypothetical protein
MSSNYVVITVSNTHERDVVMRRLYENITADPVAPFTVQKDQVNKIKVYHNVSGGLRILIRTYVVIVIPVFVDLRPLYEMTGSIDFNLENTIDELINTVKKLRSLQGRKVMKGNTNNEQTFEQLVRGLSTLNE